VEEEQEAGKEEGGKEEEGVEEEHEAGKGEEAR